VVQAALKPSHPSGVFGHALDFLEMTRNGPSLHPVVKNEGKAETQIRLSDLHEMLLSGT
jgi:hypothetical protein